MTDQQKKLIMDFLAYVRTEQMDNGRPVDDIPTKYAAVTKWMSDQGYIKPAYDGGIYVFWHKNEKNPTRTIDNLKLAMNEADWKPTVEDLMDLVAYQLYIRNHENGFWTMADVPSQILKTLVWMRERGAVEQMKPMRNQAKGTERFGMVWMDSRHSKMPQLKTFNEIVIENSIKWSDGSNCTTLNAGDWAMRYTEGEND